MSEKVPPASSASEASTPEVTCRNEATSSTKSINSTAPMDGDGGLSINQQLANHLSGHATGSPGKPPTKRKRSSIDQRSILGVKAQQPVELKKIGFIGAGNMARAIAEGWISAGTH